MAYLTLFCRKFSTNSRKKSQRSGRGRGVKPVGPNSQLLPKICFGGFPDDYHRISRNFHSCGWDVFSFPGAPRIGWTAFSTCLSLNRVIILPFTFLLKGSLPNFSFQAPFLLKLEVPDQICKILFLTKVQLRSCCDFHSVVIGF